MFGNKCKRDIDGELELLSTDLLIITERMKNALGKKVGLNQSAFIPNRLIQDNILLSRELLRGYGGKDGPNRVAMKIDIQKAYDIYCVNEKNVCYLRYDLLMFSYEDIDLLVHINKKCIEKLQHDGLLKSTNDESFDTYASCLSGKMARKPFSHQEERAKDILGLIHTDEVQNQLRKPIKALRSDHGGEFTSQEFLDHLKEHGIVSQCTPPYTLQHNSMSERINRTLLDMVRSMICQTTLPKSFWDYALEFVAHLLNMVPTKKVEKTPYKDTMMGYSFYYTPKNKVIVARNAEFFENSLITQEASGSLEDLELIQEKDMHPSENICLHHDEDEQEIIKSQSDVNPIHRSTRTCHDLDQMCLYKEHELGDHNEPTNYKVALSDPEFDKWLAMNLEMQSMKDNQVYDLVDLPHNDKTVRSKWLFKKKTNMDGNIHTYKGCLVAKGFTQTYGVDYEKTLSLVANIRAIRILIAIAAYYDYEIWQMDVKTTFLNGHLTEELVGLMLLSYYVDDILIMGNDIPMLQGVKSYIGKCFAMKDLRDVAYILGIKIYRDISRDIKRELKVTCYTDVEYLTYTDDSKSQTEYVIILNIGAIDWKILNQSIIVTSSMESEYMAALEASKEAV
ncbi:retrotransposon protein, putative, ty1-copia subclass [Tanacetum coccineum]